MICCHNYSISSAVSLGRGAKGMKSLCDLWSNNSYTWNLRPDRSLASPCLFFWETTKWPAWFGVVSVFQTFLFFILIFHEAVYSYCINVGFWIYKWDVTRSWCDCACTHWHGLKPYFRFCSSRHMLLTLTLSVKSLFSLISVAHSFWLGEWTFP